MTSHERLDGAALLTQLMGDLATVLGTLLGTAGTALPAVGPFEPAWVISAGFGGSVSGSVAVGFTDDDATALARLVLGLDEVPDEQAVADMFHEVASQAFASLGRRPTAAGLTFKIQPPRRDAKPGPPCSSVFQLAVTEVFNPLVGGWIDVTAACPEAGEAARDSTRRVGASADPAGASSPLPANLDVILDIDLPLAVRFGETEMTLEALTKLGPGSMIDLGRSPDDPVEVLVNGKLVARAEVVVVAGNYGVRIIEIMSAADRLRTLNA